MFTGSLPHGTSRLPHPHFGGGIGAGATGSSLGYGQNQSFSSYQLEGLAEHHAADFRREYQGRDRLLDQPKHQLGKSSQIDGSQYHHTGNLPADSSYSTQKTYGRDFSGYDGTQQML